MIPRLDFYEHVFAKSFFDAVLLRKNTCQETLIHTQRVCKQMATLGCLTNLSKSSLTPSQTITHLGMHINAKEMAISVPGKQIQSIRRMAYSLLRQKIVTWTHLARFIGITIATQLGNPLARFRCRHLLAQLNQSRHSTISLINPPMQQELLWWTTELQKWNGRHLLRSALTTQLFYWRRSNGYSWRYILRHWSPPTGLRPPGTPWLFS